MSTKKTTKVTQQFNKENIPNRKQDNSKKTATPHFCDNSLISQPNNFKFVGNLSQLIKISNETNFIAIGLNLLYFSYQYLNRKFLSKNKFSDFINSNFLCIFNL